jgi:hypothetical protein
LRIIQWPKRVERFRKSGSTLASGMKRTAKLCISIVFIAACTLWAGDGRVKLIPELHGGQTVTYLIRYRSDKNVKTESNVVAPMAPNAAQMDANELLQIVILDVQQQSSRGAVHARAQFLALNSGAWLKKPGGKDTDGDTQHGDSDRKSVEFAILPDGSMGKLTGLESLLPEQQQAWQSWAARFAMAWTLPQNGVKLGEKWKSDQPENSGAPIAGLSWARESTYVRNENCRAQQQSVTGEFSPSSGPPEICAVLLTTATLKQNSSPRDATPEGFKLHELKTRGTAKGTNEIITYISLKTRLVVRATEEAHQSMDVTVAKADESNRVHYNVDAKSHSEVLLVAETPRTHP